MLLIEAKFYDTNTTVSRGKTKVLEKIGMRRDTVLRNRRINEKTGRPEDLVVYSIMKEDIEENIAVS